MMTAPIGEQLKDLARVISGIEDPEDRGYLTKQGAVILRSQAGVRYEAIERWRRTTKTRRLGL